MPTKTELAQGEQDSHTEIKKSITERITQMLDELTKSEGAQAAALATGGTAAAAIIKIILALLVTPDVTWSKILAAFLGIGLAIALIYMLYKIIMESNDERQRIRESAERQEEREDARYSEAMRRIYALP